MPPISARVDGEVAYRPSGDCHVDDVKADYTDWIGDTHTARRGRRGELRGPQIRGAIGPAIGDGGRRCPELIFVPPRFEVYRSVSQQIHGVFQEFTDLIQPLSLDEGYLDVTDDRQQLGSAWKTAKTIRRRIFEETGLTASAGVSYNKFLAKLASDQNKPNGQFAVTPEMGAAWVETLPVKRFHGVGPVTAAKMERLGILTGADLRDKSLEFLKANFGSSAEWYHAIARGVDDRPVNPDRVRKSSGSETTFGEDLTDAAAITDQILRMADDVWGWCETRQRFGRTATIKLKFADFQQITRARSISGAIRSRETLHGLARELAASVLPAEKPVRLVGVTVSNFEDVVSETEAVLDLPLLAAPTS